MVESIHPTKISREQAETWLGHTTYNRPISKRAVKFMTRDINNNDWNSAVAPPIFIDEKGNGVLDGQHRLRAFLASDKDEFIAYVAEVPRKSIEVIDTGKSRSLGDTLAIRGHMYTTAKSAWINRGVQWAFGVLPSQVMTRRDQVEIIEATPNMEEIAKVSSSLRHGSPNKVIHIPTGIVACLWDMQQYGLGSEMVHEFVSLIQGNQGLDEQLGRLQAKLLNAANPRTKLRITPDAVSYLVARVFNAWANDEKLANLYARRASIEELPGYSEWTEAVFPTLI